MFELKNRVLVHIRNKLKLTFFKTTSLSRSNKRLNHFSLVLEVLRQQREMADSIKDNSSFACGLVCIAQHFMLNKDFVSNI